MEEIRNPEEFSFIVCVLDGRKNREGKIHRIERRLEEKGEGPLSWIFVSKEQNALLSDIGISFAIFNKHHPVPAYFWQRLEWFIRRFEENDPQNLKKNKDFSRYIKIQSLLMEYFEVKEINDRAKFLALLKDLEVQFSYKDLYSIPEVLHEAYNTMCRNCKPVNVIKGLDSIFVDNNYDKKKETAILRIVFTVAVLENKKIDKTDFESIEKRLEEGLIPMSEAVSCLGLNKNVIKKYIELIFLPRHYDRMSDFFELLERIKAVR